MLRLTDDMALNICIKFWLHREWKSCGPVLFFIFLFYFFYIFFYPLGPQASRWHESCGSLHPYTSFYADPWVGFMLFNELPACDRLEITDVLTILWKKKPKKRSVLCSVDEWSGFLGRRWLNLLTDLWILNEALSAYTKKGLNELMFSMQLWQSLIHDLKRSGKCGGFARPKFPLLLTWIQSFSAFIKGLWSPHIAGVFLSIFLTVGPAGSFYLCTSARPDKHDFLPPCWASVSALCRNMFTDANREAASKNGHITAPKRTDFDQKRKTNKNFLSITQTHPQVFGF